MHQLHQAARQPPGVQEGLWWSARVRWAMACMRAPAMAGREWQHCRSKPHCSPPHPTLPADALCIARSRWPSCFLSDPSCSPHSCTALIWLQLVALSPDGWKVAVALANASVVVLDVEDRAAGTPWEVRRWALGFYAGLSSLSASRRWAPRVLFCEKTKRNGGLAPGTYGWGRWMDVEDRARFPLAPLPPRSSTAPTSQASSFRPTAPSSSQSPWTPRCACGTPPQVR